MGLKKHLQTTCRAEERSHVEFPQKNKLQWTSFVSFNEAVSQTKELTGLCVTVLNPFPLFISYSRSKFNKSSTEQLINRTVNQSRERNNCRMFFDTFLADYFLISSFSDVLWDFFIQFCPCYIILYNPQPNLACTVM